MHLWFPPSIALLRSVALLGGLAALAINWLCCRWVFDRRTALISTLCAGHPAGQHCLQPIRLGCQPVVGSLLAGHVSGVGGGAISGPLWAVHRGLDPRPGRCDLGTPDEHLCGRGHRGGVRGALAVEEERVSQPGCAGGDPGLVRDCAFGRRFAGVGLDWDGPANAGTAAGAIGTVAGKRLRSALRAGNGGKALYGRDDLPLHRRLAVLVRVAAAGPA